MSARTLLRLMLAAVVAALVLLPTGPANADGYVPVSGSGSTWSQVAVDAWRADVRASGIVVNFDGVGSTYGRSQFIQGTVDFANTEIPFQNPPEPGQQAEIPKRPYAYMPIVAGGTSFMYNLTVGGQRVRDLKLSGTTLAKIFTGGITRWSDPEITKDYGKPLPDIPIVPVVRSDGAGASAQFSLYMRSQASSVYCPFIRSELHLSGSDCPSVSFYPAFGASKGQSGSNGVANYVSASYGAGAIGYVEYAYAKRIDFPVVSLLNKAGYYAQPTAGNVAVALTKAKINSDLTQNLESVYTNPDPRTYPMSSYSYMVVPTDTTKPFNSDKGKTLSAFLNYSLCGGQKKAETLGYSPLPKNLVLAGFDQIRRIPGALKSPAIDSCDNPALDILQTAPKPDPCMKVGATCGGTTTTGTTTPGAPGSTGGTGTGAGTGAAGASSTGAGAGTGGTATGGAGVGGSGAGAGAGADPLGLGGDAAGGAGVDPLTGEPVTTAGGLTTTATPVTMSDDRSNDAMVLWIAALALCLAVVAPPIVVHRMSRPVERGSTGP